MKLLGAAMIAASCGWLCAGKIRRERLALRLLGELVDVLGSMGGTIRFQRLPLPQVIATQTGRACCGTYFSAVLQYMKGGYALQKSWAEAWQKLPDRETARILQRIEWSGDETQLIGNLAYARRTLAAVNGLLAERDAQDVWTLWREEPAAQGGKASAGPAYMRRRQFTPNELCVDSLGRITARIARGNVQEVILDLCDELELNYYFQSPVNLTAGVWVDGTDFETLLSVLLKGSPYSYYTERGIWIFGAAASDGLSSATVLPLVYRAVSKVEEIIPEALKQNVAVKTFPDLNALILSGDRRDVARVETFLRSVDKPVPMVTMEILIADVTKSRIHEIGLGAGVGDKAVKTSGTLSPGVDMTFGANAVNDLLGRIRGTVNLGRVTPNFYLSLQALEEDGVVRLLSTPKLSTLNGHEATLTSGETQYYKEVQNNYYGTQNPISSESYQWKSVDANLSIKVTPYVSEDRQITLEIEFEQTEFTARNVEDAPPGTATRSFKSIVKVQNEEMVLLGGLDRNTMENSSRGVPFLARVPVIKWFFGKEKRNKVERTLNIFIKPTIVE